MDDKDLKHLFDGFNPPLPSDDSFIESLNAKLDAADIIKEKLDANNSRKRRSIILAGACGMLVGMILTAAFPWLNTWTAHIFANISILADIDSLYISSIVWIAIGAVVFTTIAVCYDLARTDIKKREAMPSHCLRKK